MIPSSPHLLFVFLLFQVFPSSHAQICDRQRPESFDTPPTYLCRLTVTVTLSSACSLNITERIWFPYTIKGNATRRIPLLASFQEITSVSLARDGKPLLVETTQTSNQDELSLTMPLLLSSDPVLLDIRYTLENGVMQWTKTCDGMHTDEEPQFNSNIWRWRAGEWDTTFDYLQVRFVPTKAGQKLRVLGDRFDSTAEPDGSMSIRAENGAGDDAEVYAQDAGAEPCSADLRCFEGEGGGVPSIGIFVVIVIAIAISALGLYLACRMFQGYRHRKGGLVVNDFVESTAPARSSRERSTDRYSDNYSGGRSSNGGG